MALMVDWSVRRTWTNVQGFDKAEHSLRAIELALWKDSSS
jgi:hypothetical protein